MAQQTAVEWFSFEIFNQFELLKRGIINDEEFRNGLLNKRDHSKQMEKEQIISAYKADRYPCSYEDAEQYYNETYKTQAQ